MILLETSAAPNPQDLFTVGSFATLLGATTIVYIVCGVIQSVFNFGPKWFALAVSIIVSFIGASIDTGSTTDSYTISEGLKYLIALLNGFLIYSSSVGSNQLIAKKQNAPPQPQHRGPQAAQAPTRRTFTSNWFN